MRVGGTSGVNNAGKRDRVQGKDEHKTVNDVNELLRVVQRKVTVKGSGGVVATVVVIVQRGKVWMSIQPPFTWDAIMAPGMVEELIRTLALAAEDAKKMVSGTRVSRGGSCPPGPPGHQGHVKITACAELVALSDELWNTAALVFPAQSTLSLKCSL